MSEAWKESLNQSNEVIKSDRLGVATTVSELERMYVDEKMSCGQIADELEVSHNTAMRFLDRAGIKRREYTDPYENEKYRDGSWLREKYVEEGKTQTEIGEECGVHTNTIGHWLREFDIPIRKQGGDHCKFNFSSNSYAEGYPTWTATGGAADIGYLAVHRLVAVANGADPYKVFSDEMYQVHHRNGFKCDNRPSNLQVIDRRTHGRHHTPDQVHWTDDDMEFAIRFMMNPTQYMRE